MKYFIVFIHFQIWLLSGYFYLIYIFIFNDLKIFYRTLYKHFDNKLKLSNIKKNDYKYIQKTVKKLKNKKIVETLSNLFSIKSKINANNPFLIDPKEFVEVFDEEIRNEKIFNYKGPEKKKFGNFVVDKLANWKIKSEEKKIGQFEKKVLFSFFEIRGKINLYVLNTIFVHIKLCESMVIDKECHDLLQIVRLNDMYAAVSEFKKEIQKN